MQKTTANDGQYKQAISDLNEELYSLGIKTSALEGVNNQLKGIITEQLPNCPIPNDGIEAAGAADHDQPESAVLDGDPERSGDTQAASKLILHLNEVLIKKLGIFKSLMAQNGRLKRVVAGNFPEHPVLGGKTTATDEHLALSGGGEQNVETELSFPIDLIRIVFGEPTTVTGVKLSMSNPSKTKAICLKGFGIKLNTTNFDRLDYQVIKSRQDPLPSIDCHNLQGNQVIFDTPVPIDMDTEYFIKVRIFRDDSMKEQHWHYHELGEVKKTIDGIQLTIIKHIFEDTLISDLLFDVRSV